MMSLPAVVDSVLQTIGRTPVVHLQRLIPRGSADVFVKLEYFNPTGSYKDRMALAMIAGAERDGLISPGDTIVEYTGGSTGPALALVCRSQRRVTFTVRNDEFTLVDLSLRCGSTRENVIYLSKESSLMFHVEPRSVANFAYRLTRLP